MTVIAWDGKTLAADRQATYGEMKNVTTKVFRFDNRLMAGAGEHTGVHAIINWLTGDMKAEKYPKNVRASVWVVVKGGPTLRFEDSPYPVTIEDLFWADGTGGCVALGALAMGATARKAVELAAQHCTGCGMGVSEMSFDADGE